MHSPEDEDAEDLRDATIWPRSVLWISHRVNLPRLSWFRRGRFLRRGQREFHCQSEQRQRSKSRIAQYRDRTINDNETVSGPNPIDQAAAFVRQQYVDFLNREPDSAGLAFWTNEITSCGNDQQCVDAKRVNVSAAFFLSIEFQETGYLVYRSYKAAYGNLSGAPVPLTLSGFLPDTQQMGKGVVVGVGNWQAQLENNKQAFALDFVSKARFSILYPTSAAPAAFVDALYAKAGVTPTTAERNAAINEFASGATTTADAAARARVLRRVVENGTFSQQELNRAFVLMQYFGYLRRNPNDAPELGLNFDGYNFWLDKLNQFNGNFVDGDMVKSFLVSGEYRQWFGLQVPADVHNMDV